MPFVYMLYSEELNRYYVGSTRESVEERLYKYNHQHNGFTTASSDWKLLYCEDFTDYSKAPQREREINKWKSRKLIEKLLKST